MKYKAIILKETCYLCPCEIEDATEIIDGKDKIIYELSEELDNLKKSVGIVTEKWKLSEWQEIEIDETRWMK